MTEHRALLTCGEHAVLVEVGGLDQVLAFTHAVRKATSSTSSRRHRLCLLLSVKTSLLGQCARPWLLCQLPKTESCS